MTGELRYRFKLSSFCRLWSCLVLLGNNQCFRSIKPSLLFQYFHYQKLWTYVK